MTARHINTYGKNNVSIIINNRLCIHCGACSSICPTNAIMWNECKRTPIIIDEKCVNCKLCLKICPSYNTYRDYYLLYKDFSSFLMGPVLETYLAWSKNSRLRYDASSGGFITQLLLDLMKLKLIDGAIVTIPDIKRPYLAKAIIAEHPHEVLDAKGSKYTISSLRLVVRELLNKDGHYAVVGLPCHILMFKRLEKLFSKLKNKIVLHIGLFCGHVVYPTLYYIILNKELKCSKENARIISIKYRGSGWPGYLEITLSDGTKLKLPHDYWVSNYFSSMIYTPKRCQVCNDVTAELADIAVGDPWIKILKNREKAGISLVVIRTVRGKYYLNRALEIGNIAYVKIPKQAIIVSQSTNIIFKKVKLPYRLRFVYMPDNLTIFFNYKDIIREKGFEKILSYLGSFMIMNDGSNKVLTNLFKLLPRKLISLYSILMYFLFLKSTSYKLILDKLKEVHRNSHQKS